MPLEPEADGEARLYDLIDEVTEQVLKAIRAEVGPIRPGQSLVASPRGFVRLAARITVATLVLAKQRGII
jgi:hypothetical protein